MDEKLRIIFFVDDEPLIRKAVAQSLSVLRCSVTVFASGEQCLRALRREPCDLLISDINMEGLSGVKLLEIVRQKHPLLPVILITGFGDIPTAIRAVKLGAVDFIEKPLDEDTFLPIVEKALSESKARTLDDNPLTESELVVLRMIAEGKSNKEIADQLGRSLRTIENHRHRLMRKLEVANTADLVKLAVSSGLA